MGEDVSWIAKRFTNEPMKHVGIKFESLSHEFSFGCCIAWLIMML
jgi:hypothetical protein